MKSRYAITLREHSLGNPAYNVNLVEADSLVCQPFWGNITLSITIPDEAPSVQLPLVTKFINEIIIVGTVE